MLNGKVLDLLMWILYSMQDLPIAPKLNWIKLNRRIVVYVAHIKWKTCLLNQIGW